MQALKFDLYGRFAHFKNPENNIKLELSYENIPKTVLLGQLGAILGLKGKAEEKELGYLEFYRELKDIKVSIVPHSAKFSKHIESFNNSTGFANKVSKIQATQIIRRQILEDVRWTIFILTDSMESKYFDELYKMLIARTSKFPLYLGKIEFKTRLGKVELVELDEMEVEDVEKCDSIILSKFVTEIDKDPCGNHFIDDDNFFLREDYMPSGYNEIGLYKLEKFIFTNSDIEVKNGEFYKSGNIVLNFY